MIEYNYVMFNDAGGGYIFDWTVLDINGHGDYYENSEGELIPVLPKYCVDYSDNLVWMYPNYRHLPLLF